VGGSPGGGLDAWGMGRGLGGRAGLGGWLGRRPPRWGGGLAHGVCPGWGHTRPVVGRCFSGGFGGSQPPVGGTARLGAPAPHACCGLQPPESPTGLGRSPSPFFRRFQAPRGRTPDVRGAPPPKGGAPSTSVSARDAGVARLSRSGGVASACHRIMERSARTLPPLARRDTPAIPSLVPWPHSEAAEGRKREQPSMPSTPP
jgi:hypothetical protein